MTTNSVNFDLHSHNRHTRVAIERVQIQDYKKAAKTLRIAFKEDLYLRYLTGGINDEKLKEQLDLALYEATVYSTILSGLVVAVRDVEGEKTDKDCPFLAVACFEKPRPHSSNHPSLLGSLWSMYKGGYLKFIWLANKETRQRVLEEQSNMLEEFRYDVLGDEFASSWYLSDIAAIPKGRGKGLARALIEYVCRTYIDKTGEDPDLQVEDFGSISARESGRSSGREREGSTAGLSALDSEINSFRFSFDNDLDNYTDYSGYSSDSDASSAHSSWYYKEEDDILAQYDKQKSREQQEVGAPLYLESSHPRNKKIYQRIGFTYVKTVEVAQVRDKKGEMMTLTLDLMVRGRGGRMWQPKSS